MDSQQLKRVLDVLEELIEQYGGRDLSTYGSPNGWLLDPPEKQNPEIRDAIELLTELQNAYQESKTTCL
jgi:hypothetical protein